MLYSPDDHEQLPLHAPGSWRGLGGFHDADAVSAIVERAKKERSVALSGMLRRAFVSVLLPLIRAIGGNGSIARIIFGCCAVWVVASAAVISLFYL